MQEEEEKLDIGALRLALGSEELLKSSAKTFLSNSVSIISHPSEKEFLLLENKSAVELNSQS